MLHLNKICSKKLKKQTIFLLLLLTSCLLCVGIPKVLATVPTSTAIAQNQTTSIEQAKTLYDAGKYSEAVAILQQAIANFKTQGNSLKQAMALSNLSLAYQQLGLWTEAESAITESLKLLQSQPSPDTTKILAQTLDIQGRLQLSLGQAEAALNTWQQATNNYTQVGDKLGVIASRLNQAQALQTLGFIDALQQH